jgi:WD40 repeat protein/uncharacterized caspase-like protein
MRSLSDSRLHRLFAVGAAVFALASAAALTSAAGQADYPIEPVPLLGYTEDAAPQYTVSPDERLIASVQSGDETIRLWDVATKRLLRVIRSEEPGWFIAPTFDESGNVVAALGGQSYEGYSSSFLRFWNASTGQPIFAGEQYERQYAALAAAAPTRLAAPGDRSFLATLSIDGRIQLWSFTSGLPYRTLGEARAEYQSEAFAISPDGRLAATAEFDGPVTIWDLASGERHIVAFGMAYGRGIEDMGFSASGSHLIVLRNDGLEAIDVRQARTAWRLPEPAGNGFEAIHFAPRARRLVVTANVADETVADTGTRGVIRFLDDETGIDMRQPLELSLYLNSFGISASGEVAVGNEYLRPMHLLPLEASHQQPMDFGPTFKPILDGALTRDGRRVFIADSSGRVLVWSTTDGTFVGAVETGAAWHGQSDYGRIQMVQPLGNGDTFLVLYVGQAIDLWNLAGERLWRLTEEDIDAYFVDDDAVRSLMTVSGDGQRMLVRSFEGEVLEFDIGSGARIRKIPAQGNIRAAAFSSGGRLLALLGQEGTLEVQDYATGERVAMLSGVGEDDGGSYDEIAFLGEAQIFLKVSGHDAAVWDLVTERRLATFPNDIDYGTVAVDPVERRVMTADSGGRILIRSIDTGTELTRFVGHSGMVEFGGFAGDLAITAAGDGTILTWDARTGRQLLLSAAGTDPDDWISATPAGFFNVSGDGGRLLAVVNGLEAYGVEQFFNALYRPDLVQALLAGDPALAYEDAAAALNLRTILESGTLPQITILATEQVGGELRILGEVAETNNGGVGDIAISVRGEDDGRAIQRAYLPGARGEVLTAQHNCVTVPAAVACLVLDRTVPLESGRNTISIVAYNGANLLATDPVEIVWQAGKVTVPRGDLYVLALGVEDYAAGGVRGLSSAVDDAEAVADALTRMRDPDLYENVHVEVLRNAQVTRSNLEQVFTRLGQTVRPEDKFVFFVAGHGTTRAGRYYFFPQDFTYDGGGTIRNGAIDQDQWNLWFDRIKARASLFLYDTCEAGTVARNDDLAKEGALRRMVTAMGRNVITASSAEQPAMESRDHGLFTRVLLEAFAGADYNGNDFVDITDLQLYVDDRVPVLSREWYGVAQDPTISIQANFPVGRMAALEIEGASAAAAIPAEPNGAMLADAQVRDAAGNVVGTIARGTPVRVLESGEQYRIARDGLELGFVPADAVLEFAQN